MQSDECEDAWDLTDEQIDAARAYAAEHADEMAPDPEDDDDPTPGAKP